MTIHQGPTMAHRVDHSHVDTMETRFRDIERRMMTALEMVNRRVSYQTFPELTSKRVWRPVRPWLGLRLTELQGTRVHSLTVLKETEVKSPLSGSRPCADDLAVQYIIAYPALEAGARLNIGGHSDKEALCTKQIMYIPDYIWMDVLCYVDLLLKMAPKEGPTELNPDATPTPATPAPNAPTTTTVTEAQLQALIDQGVAPAMAEAEASRVRNATIAMVLQTKAQLKLLANATLL
ncbi:hypothetical protein Tco_0058359 [Tanacetum coccineum]